MRKPIASSFAMIIARIMTSHVAPTVSMPVALAFLKVIPPMFRPTLILACVLLISVQSHADIITPPGLSPGDQFRIVFTTDIDYRMPATSPNIGDYDNLIQNNAVFAGLDTYNGQAVNWMVLGSTPAVSAVSRVPLSSDVPIYRVDGVEVADNATDLWDGSIDAPINLTASGGDTVQQSVEHVLGFQPEWYSGLTLRRRQFCYVWLVDAGRQWVVYPWCGFCSECFLYLLRDFGGINCPRC